MLTAEPWGKLARDDDGRELARLPLVEHCIDVAAVARALLEQTTVRNRLECLAKRTLSDVDCSRLVALAFLHDVGKTSLGFQSKSLAETDRLTLLRSKGLHFHECGHTTIVGPLLRNREFRKRLIQALPFKEICEWDGYNLWLAAVSHHGTPIRDEELPAQPTRLWESFGSYDPWAALRSLGDASIKLFPLAFAPGGTLPDQAAFCHAFAGLVSLADWIGSNPKPGFFPYDLAKGSLRWDVAVDRARDVLKRMRVDVDALVDDVCTRHPEFGDVFMDPNTGAFEPNDMQRAMERLDLGPLVVLEAETGSGKTEAALWRFKTLFAASQVDSLAFVLPTRVSAVQIEKRARAFVKGLFPNAELCPNVVLAVPGYLRADGDEAEGRLASFEVLWPDSPDEDAAHRRWAAENTKRYLAAACAIGTIDQVLLSGLQVRHAHLRGFALLRSLLVVDEVHASDIYMRRILRNVLRRHVDSGGHALLLSATLGKSACDAFFERSANESRSEPTRPYPAITDNAGTVAVGASQFKKSVTVELRAWIDDPGAIAAAACEAVSLGGRVLIIRNTVASVVAVQQALEAQLGDASDALFRCEGVACPHHGRFAAADRRLLDEAVEAQFGKEAPVRPLVLCGTQTLEQSLDIDADLLITDLVPMDVLLQRIGRLHRHRRARLDAFSAARTIVVTPDNRDLLSYLRTARNGHGFKPERAYENVLSVEATWAELERRPQLTIPDDNRDLVERATDPDTLESMAVRLGADWLERWQRLEGRSRAHSIDAAHKCLDWSVEWDRAAFANGAEERIRTRLGADALRVPLPQPWKSPFDVDLAEIAIPAWMWRGPADIQDIERCGEQDFIVNQQRFSYSRLGLLPRPP